MPRLNVFLCVLLGASVLGGTGHAASARATLEEQGWISLAGLAERLQVSSWELRQWIDTNVPAEQTARAPVWTRSAWVPLVYVSPEAAEAADRRFHSGRSQAVADEPWPEADERAAAGLAGFDLALLGMIFFPRESRLEASPGAELTLQYRFNDHVALGLDGGFLRVDVAGDDEWLGSAEGREPADFDLFPVGLSLLLDTHPTPRLGAGIRGGAHSLVSDEEPTFQSPGPSSIIGADLDDGLVASVLLHLHARIGEHWCVVVETGYQFDIERPELRYDSIGRDGHLHRSGSEISVEGAMIRCGLSFEL